MFVTSKFVFRDLMSSLAGLSCPGLLLYPTLEIYAVPNTHGTMQDHEVATYFATKQYSNTDKMAGTRQQDSVSTSS